MNNKSLIFNKFLMDKDIKCFKIKETTDEFGTVLFTSHMEICGEQLSLIVINDTSIYTVIRVMLLNKIKKEKELLVKINQLNREYKAFKYYIVEDNLFLDICIPCDKTSYNSEIIYTLLDVLLKHLIKEYKTLKKYGSI